MSEAADRAKLLAELMNGELVLVRNWFTGSPYSAQQEQIASQFICSLLSENKTPPSSTKPSDREQALAEALQLVLDDWANSNTILEDAQVRAHAALSMPSATRPLTAYIEELERRAAEQMEWEKHPKCEDDGVGTVMQVIANELRALDSSGERNG